MDIGIFFLLLVLIFIIFTMIYKGPWQPPRRDKRDKLWFGD